MWNRLRYIKDPESGKRVSRLNPRDEWVIEDVPALRIVDQPLWDKVKARQGEQVNAKFGERGPGFWDRRRPRYLFSGLTRCGVCGGGFTNLSGERIGCSAARERGTCDNRRTMKRAELEATVLDGLQHHLMDPALCEVFCEEYTRHMNRIRMDYNAALAGKQAELDKVTRELDRLIQAIMDGVPGVQLKDRIAALEERKAVLEAALDGAEDAPVLVHPNMGAHYRAQVSRLREALTDESRRAEVAELIRGLVDRIVLTPVEHNGRKTLAVDLLGHIAGILAMATQTKKPPQRGGVSEESIKLVAGAGFEPATFRL